MSAVVTILAYWKVVGVKTSHSLTTFTGYDGTAFTLNADCKLGKQSALDAAWLTLLSGNQAIKIWYGILLINDNSLKRKGKDYRTIRAEFTKKNTLGPS